jgi:hypothetical protein
MIKLGDEVIDTVSGFKGVAVSSHNYLNGCTRITIQPKIGNDGKLPETQTFDEPQLKTISNKKHKSDNTNGGPEKYSDNRKY